MRVRWEDDLVKKRVVNGRSVITIPEYYKLVKTDTDDKGKWIAVLPTSLPC